MKTWVIKIGTSILRGTEETSTEEVIENLSRSFTSFLSKGNKLILVTSGAVGLGCQKLNIKTRPNDLSTCLLYTSPSPRDVEESRMPSSA